MDKFSKIDQWNCFEHDLQGMKEDEEILFTLGGRQYVARVATEKDIQIHETEGTPLDDDEDYDGQDAFGGGGVY